MEKNNSKTKNQNTNEREIDRTSERFSALNKSTYSLQPASTIHQSSTENLSIFPDLATGWRPKATAIPPPILVKYREDFITSIINHSAKDEPLKYRIVFLGKRNYNSFSFHSQTIHDYHVRFGIKNEELPEKFQAELEKYKATDQRPFEGMNPELKHKGEITFSSNFESGNLDMAIEVENKAAFKEYDLFLRPDTNTCGHTQWFYFKVNLPLQAPSKAKRLIKFNILNNRKFQTLYCKGMKPYVFSQAQFEKDGIGWHQSGKNVTYKKFKNFRYNFEDQIFKQTEDFIEEKEEPQEQETDESEKVASSFHNQQQKSSLNSEGRSMLPTEPKQIYSSLSFEYEFQEDETETYFAYCVPYTYSTLKKDILSIKKKAAKQEICLDCKVSEEKLCVSLSGLDVPILTFTDESIPEEAKKIFFSTARIHPGESNGSHVVKGFMEYLVSKEAESLRKVAIFKVIPMINPDGVILGNFRTGLAGKDLNRQFKVKNLDFMPEIQSLKYYIRKTKASNPKSLTYFLDFHGHSSKKNVFVYGPQYEVWDLKYERSRILPKILARNTEMFKMSSCLYKIKGYKKSTARAFMLGSIPYCYTVESSIGIFQDKTGKNVEFNTDKWEEMGYKIGEVIFDSLESLNVETLNLMKKKSGKKTKRNSNALATKLGCTVDDKVLSISENNSEVNFPSEETKEKSSNSTTTNQSSSNSNRDSSKKEHIKNENIISTFDASGYCPSSSEEEQLATNELSIENTFPVSKSLLLEQESELILNNTTDVVVDSFDFDFTNKHFPLTSSSSTSSKNHKQSQKYLQPIKNFKTKQLHDYYLKTKIEYSKISEVENENDENEDDEDDYENNNNCDESEDEEEDDGKSDCESDINDFDKKEYEIIRKDINQVIANFEKVVGLKKAQKNFSISKKKPRKHHLSDMKNSNKNSYKREHHQQEYFTSPSSTAILKHPHHSTFVKINTEEMKMVPSLKHKIPKIIEERKEGQGREREHDRERDRREPDRKIATTTLMIPSGCSERIISLTSSLKQQQENENNISLESAARTSNKNSCMNDKVEIITMMKPFHQQKYQNQNLEQYIMRRA